jgi:hypothetical protein
LHFEICVGKVLFHSEAVLVAIRYGSEKLIVFVYEVDINKRSVDVFAATDQ